MPLPVDIVDALMLALQGEREDIHTALPGKVVKYYPDSQTADVQPMLKRPSFDEDDNRLDGESLPLLPHVPVAWPRAGGYIITMPMGTGDFVWVMFSEAGTGEFRTTGQESEPFDISRHALTYPVCMPGCCPDTLATNDVDVVANDKMVIGAASGQARITVENWNGVSSKSTVAVMPGLACSIEASTANPLNPADPARVIFGGGTDAPALASSVDALANALMDPSIIPSGTETGLTALKAALVTWATAYFHGGTTKSQLIRTK